MSISEFFVTSGALDCFHAGVDFDVHFVLGLVGAHFSALAAFQRLGVTLVRRLMALYVDIETEGEKQRINLLMALVRVVEF